MARELRIEVSDLPRHAMGRGVDRRRIFVDDDDYQRYLRLLATTVGHFRWRLLAFCLMPNHVHLLLITPRANLGKGMQFLHGIYARTFNERHGRKGHLFEDRYRAPRPIANEGKVVELVGYIATNPVTAALSKRPEDWPWSSHALVAKRPAPPWLAHDLLEEMLRDITGHDSYHQLVARYQRTRC